MNWTSTFKVSDQINRHKNYEWIPALYSVRNNLRYFLIFSHLWTVPFLNFARSRCWYFSANSSRHHSGHLQIYLKIKTCEIFSVDICGNDWLFGYCCTMVVFIYFKKLYLSREFTYLHSKNYTDCNYANGSVCTCYQHYRCYFSILYTRLKAPLPVFLKFWIIPITQRSKKGFVYLNKYCFSDQV